MAVIHQKGDRFSVFRIREVVSLLEQAKSNSSLIEAWSSINYKSTPNFTGINHGAPPTNWEEKSLTSDFKVWCQNDPRWIRLQHWDYPVRMSLRHIGSGDTPTGGRSLTGSIRCHLVWWDICFYGCWCITRLPKTSNKVPLFMGKGPCYFSLKYIRTPSCLF